MNNCLVPIAPNIFVARPRSSVENLANSPLQGELRLRKRRYPGVLAAIFQGKTYYVERDTLECALILGAL